MAGSSKEAQKYLEPPGPALRPIESSPFPQPRNGLDRAQSQAGDLPTTSIMRSPWLRKPDPNRLTKHVQIDDQPVAYPEHDDVELGRDATAAAGSETKNRMVCGRSKSTFIIVLFFVIVVVAAAIGGGVGGSFVASKG